MGRSAEAKTMLQELAKTGAQSFTAATIRLSAVAAGARDTPGAHAPMDEVPQQQPHNVDASVARANLLFRNKQYDDTLASAEEAVRADPARPRRSTPLPRVHGARHDWDDARGEPVSPRPCGPEDRSQRGGRKALLLDPQFAGSAEAQRVLTELKE